MATAMDSTWDPATVEVVGNIFADDPYLAYQPAFAYTLPIQLIVNGMTLTLLCVLLLHLLFTIQYHYPLAPLNYVLQLISILVVIISVIVKIIVIMQNSGGNADLWPYDLDYIAVPVPPAWWTIGQDGAWFFLQALNSGFSNITHIQFLTLLYPSRTEARLIIFVLGPLAIASSALVFTSLASSQTVIDIGDAIRNVFNSTLLLIFTTALFIWGFYVNRRRAWRLDGGTAMFGFGSLFLAVISTTFNFVAVKEDGLEWLQHLLFAAILWQTWLGWWWWVGSGMGIGEVEDIVERAERKKRKAAKRAGKRPAGPKRARSASQFADASVAAITGLSSNVTGILRHGPGPISRRRTSQSVSSGHPIGDVEEGIEMDNLRAPSASETSEARRRHTGTPAQHVEFSDTSEAGRRGGLQTTNSETSSTSQTPSLHRPRTAGQLFALPATWLQVYLRRLRHAHEDAAKAQAIERAELRARVFEGGGNHHDGLDKSRQRAARAEAALVEGQGVGWGLGSFGIKEHREGARRIQEAGDRLRAGRLLGGEEDDLAEQGDLETPIRMGPADGAEPVAGPSRPPGAAASSEDAGPSKPSAGITPASGSTARDPQPGGSGADDAAPAGSPGAEDDWEDLNDNTTSTSETPTNGRISWFGRRRAAARDKGKERASPGEQPSFRPRGQRDRPAFPIQQQRQGEDDRGTTSQGVGWSWWGPLKDWRLNDRSTF